MRDAPVEAADPAAGPASSRRPRPPPRSPSAGRHGPRRSSAASTPSRRAPSRPPRARCSSSRAPGSGKTRVVAHRIAYLIGAKGVPPRRILAVTFTNRAAGELRERIQALVGEHGKEVDAGTFHSLCARVLRRDGEAIGLDRRFVIYDTDDQQQLMKRILAEQDLPATGEFRPSAILGRDQPRQERHARRDVPRPERGQPPGARHRAAGPALRGAAGDRRRARLRRPAAQGRRAVRALAGDPRALPGALAVPPRGRVPGHEPAAVPVGQGPRVGAPQPRGRRATTTSRSTAGAAPTSRTSSTSSATIPTRRS